MKKILSVFIVLIYVCSNILSIATAVTTNNQASPWTREKAAHLAKITLFNADNTIIDSLFAAWSAKAALDIIFPDANGPDRSLYDAAIANYTGSGFNWGDSNHVTRLYQMIYTLDPYEWKRKLFSLFEDIFSVNRDTDRDITYKDVDDLHDLLFANMFWSYQTLVKKVLYNNGLPGDYAQSRFLDLFNQKDPINPNENYARELLQLFLMWEYEPYKSKDNNDIRNYEESDVKALARILTGLKSDPMTHAVSFDIATHYVGSGMVFLSGALTGITPPYYNTLSGTVDPLLILTPVNSNNGLTDNVIEYIFAKRSDQIALFLADRLARFYINDTPTRQSIDQIAQIIKDNNFEMLPVVKSMLSMDIVYSDASMNAIRYKNPLELSIGTIRQLRQNSLSGMLLDPNMYDTNLLRRLGWTPYFPGSVFGRDGFDNSLKWSSTSNQSAWMSASNYFTYRTTGTGAIDFLSLLGNQRREITTGSVSIMTHSDNSYIGSLTILSWTISLGSPIVPVVMQSVARFAAFSTENTPEYVYPIDPIESILGWENLELFASEPVIFLTDIPSQPDQVDSTDASTSENLDTTVVEEKTDIVEKSDTISVDVFTGGIENTGAVIAMSMVLVDTGSTVGSVDPILSSDTQTGETSTGGIENTGAVITETGTTNTGTTITGSTDTGVIVTDPITTTGSSETGSILSILPVTNQVESIVALAVVTSTLSISTGSVVLPNFRINTGLWVITVFSGTYTWDTKTLVIHSGSILSGSLNTEVVSATIVFDANSRLFADTVSTTEILDTYEVYIYGEKRLWSEIRTIIDDFLNKNSSWATIPVAPTNVNYFNKKIRGLLSILLAQPEFVLLTGYDLPTSTNTTDQHFLDNVTGKLFFVELYGGNDYLTSIIPKDEYSTYLDYRTNQTGSIAITGTGLVDIGDFYMNSALAYGSGGGLGFKDLYDRGYLKIFNRVGWYKHSNDHDAAAKQISSYDSSTAISAEGAFGHLVKSEFESSHTISLGSKSPNIYRAGHYVNLGWSVILNNPLDQGGQLKSHMDVMQNITLSRSYPANTRDLFKDAGRISEIWKLSVAQGGPSGANGDMNNVFKFAKVLMNNNIGRSFYMGGYGWYDTHGDQFTGLNRNLNFVSTAVTNFFNEVKDTQDVTIVIFSEFGRTNKTNGDLWTDHGDGGWMYVITSNTALRNQLQAGTYGNMSIKNAKYNSLGIGIDYRSVYGSIFNSLYWLDPSTYFAAPIDIFKDISLDPNRISLLNYSYQASGQTPLLNVELTVTGSNYNPGKAWYTRLLSWTGMVSTRNTRLNEKTVGEGYRYNFQINPNSQTYFTLESFSNQYALTGFSWSLTGSTRPMILWNSIRTVSQTGTSIMPLFGNTVAPVILSGSGIILESTGSKMVSFPDNNFARIGFWSWLTNVIELTTATGTMNWRWGFVFGQPIDKNLFIPSTATITSDGRNIPVQNISHLFRIGADLRWVWMKLNQRVSIEFSGVPLGERYRVISSQDGINWSDVESSGATYSPSLTGSITVSTDHFSYFALFAGSILIPPPSCTISISPNTVTNGSGAILSWNMTNSSTGILNPGNMILGASGSTIIVPPSNATTPYTLSVSNPSWTNSCTASVTAMPVVTPPVTPPPSCTISISPNTVTNGSGAILSWSMTNSSTGILNPGNVSLWASGSTIIVPPSNATTSYIISMNNGSGIWFCSAAVTASSVVPPVVVPPTPGNTNTGVIVWPGGAWWWGSYTNTATIPSTTPTKPVVYLSWLLLDTVFATKTKNNIESTLRDAIIWGVTTSIIRKITSDGRVLNLSILRLQRKLSMNTISSYTDRRQTIMNLQELYKQKLQLLRSVSIQ